jgi:organic radical activating enzyme
MKGKISEVFDSVQGEGLYLGEKQLFVRFFGCNLWCRFCDTKQDAYIEYEPQELFEELKLYGNVHHSISFTGGEPLLQKNFLKEVLKLTRKDGYKHYLETNGTLVSELEDIIDYLDIIAMDLKLPSSTDMVCVWGMHRRFLRVASQKEVFLKTIICESTKESDLREATSIIREINNSAVLILQPNSHERNSKALQEKLLLFKDLCRKDRVTACVIEQMHKVIGVR